LYLNAVKSSRKRPVDFRAPPLGQSSLIAANGLRTQSRYACSLGLMEWSAPTWTSSACIASEARFFCAIGAMASSARIRSPQRIAELFPRDGGPSPPIETVELPHSVVSLEFDEKNGLLLVFGEDGIRFYSRAQLSSAAGQLGVAGEPLLSSEQFRFGGYEGQVLVRYCD
jgi:hypothetical protein